MLASAMPSVRYVERKFNKPIERGQSDARISYAEREDYRTKFNKPIERGQSKEI